MAAPAGAAPPRRSAEAHQPPCSRICVKNVPRHCTEARLREHFAARGEVTDAKILRTSDGRSRQIAFVGFKTGEQAQESVRYFHRTFMDTSRLDCALASVHGQVEAAARPWSKYSAGSSRHDAAAAAVAGGAAPAKPAEALKAREAKKAARAAKAAAAPPPPAAPEEDPQLAEFLALMQPRRAQKLWADATGAAAEGAVAAAAGGARRADGSAAAQPSGSGDDSDDDALYQDLGARGPRGGAPSDEEAEDAAAKPKQRKTKKDKDAAPPTQAAPPAAMSDAEYLRSRTRAHFSDSEQEEAEEEAESDDDAAHAADDDVAEDDDAADADADVAAMDAEAGAAGAPAVRTHAGSAAAAAEGAALLAETGRLFVRNLPYTATEEELASLFSEFGELSATHVLVDKASGRSKGLAYVQFASPARAAEALAQLDGAVFQGRLLHCLPAARAPAPPGGEASDAAAAGAGAAAGSAYKAAKEAKLKASAGDARAWSTLFMRPDTVAAALASRYGVSKADVMEPGSSSAAVRLALGEAQIVADTKRELAAAGVDVAALEAAAASRAGGAAASKVTRSTTVLLLKNLPYSADGEELRSLAGRHGSVARLLLPASRALALLEFLEPSHARAAFAGLAYKKYHHVPLYVEWAPEGLLPPPDASAAQAAKQAAKTAAAAAAKRAPVSAAGLHGDVAAAGDGGGGDADELGDEGGGGARSVFVKNLSFATDDAALRRHVDAALPAAARGKVRAARVARRPGKTPGGPSLSCGYGFVEFDSGAAAAAARAALDGSALDGHVLIAQLSRGGGGGGSDGNDAAANKRPLPASGGGAKAASDAAAAQPAGAGGTKLVVRNVAFEANKGELRALFSPFGAVKNLRLPRKFDGQHRGFAFVELSTRAEARAAFEAVGGTHLYGRHLVTEWAQQDEGVDALRQRTAQRFAAGEEAHTGSAASKQRKKQRV